MTAPRILDFTPPEPKETGLDRFFARMKTQYKDKQDQDTLSKILKAHQKNREDVNSYEDTQIQIMDSNMSPTKKMAALDQMNTIKKNLIEERKSLNQKYANVPIEAKQRAKQKKDLLDIGLVDAESEVVLDNSNDKVLRASVIQYALNARARGERPHANENLLRKLHQEILNEQEQPGDVEQGQQIYGEQGQQVGGGQGQPDDYEEDIDPNVDPLGAKHQSETRAFEQQYAKDMNKKLQDLETQNKVLLEQQKAFGKDNYDNEKQEMLARQKQERDAVKGTTQTTAPVTQKSTPRPPSTPLSITPPTTTQAQTKTPSKQPEKEKYPEPEVPRHMNLKEKVAWENENEKTNNKQLLEHKEMKKALRDAKINLNIMTQANNSGKLPHNLGSLMIDPSTGDIRGVAQILGLTNAETEVYVKNLKNFVKNAKTFFGGRVTNFDLTTFMAQLPSLLNSQSGRNLILKQMSLSNELDSIEADTSYDTILHYGRKANINQITRVSGEEVAEKSKEPLFKLNMLIPSAKYVIQMNANPEKYRNTVLIYKEGKIIGVDKKDLDHSKERGWIEL